MNKIGRNWINRCRVGVVGICVAALAGTACAVEWNLTGSVGFEGVAYLDGKDVVEHAGLQKTDLEMEHVHLRISADLSERYSFILEPCLSHHEALSVKLAYLEAVLVEDGFETLLGAEVGRFIVPFGRFNLLAEADLYPTISRPMMFASHDQGIIIPDGFPRPIFMTEYSDMGATLNGNKWFEFAEANHQLWYAVWMANGFYQEGFEGHEHGSGEHHEHGGATDMAWLQEKRFISDNNENKVVGGQLSYAAGEMIRVGGSYMQGSYDPDSTLEYSAAGVDVSLKLGKLHVDAEYVYAPTDFSAPAVTNDLDVINVEDYVTSGYYIQVRYPFCKKWEAVAMYDVLERDGPVFEKVEIAPMEHVETLPEGGPEVTTTTTKMSVGLNYAVNDNVKVKTEFAYFCFDASDAPDPDDVQRVSTALVITF